MTFVPVLCRSLQWGEEAAFFRTYVGTGASFQNLYRHRHKFSAPRRNLRRHRRKFKQAMMTQAQYAKRRGVARSSVTRAIASGRLSRSVATVDSKRVIADPELADQEWLAATDYSKAPSSVKERYGHTEGGEEPKNLPDSDAAVMPLALESAREKHWKARLAELEFRTKAAQFVDVNEVRAAVIDKFVSAKTKLLGIPSRIRQRMPHISIADIAEIDGLVREALEDLSNAKF